MSSTPPLNYAPPPPVHQRRLFKRSILILTVLAFICSGWWWAPPIWLRLQLVYWQRECMIYTPTVDQPIYDESTGVGQTPAPWSKFYGLLSPPGFRSDGTLFLHEMRKRNGERRLVAADVELTNLTYQITPKNLRIEVWVREFNLGGIARKPFEISCEAGRNYTSSGFGTILAGTRVYAAKLDPMDSSHFTFVTRDEHREYQYDGWLQDDDTIAISERRGKSTQPVP